VRRILVLGSNGQVGWELQRALAPLGEVIALDRAEAELKLPKGETACGDLMRVERLAATVQALQPSVVVNAAAYTAVDKAEIEHEAARTVNAEAPGALAAVCVSMGALLIHYSTDYVFDGSGDAPWREEDTVAPLNVYGQTKLDGERRIRESGCRHLILRTSWVYAARGANFIRTMLRLASKCDALNVVADQVGAPTGAELLADLTAHALRRLEGRDDLCGTYHATASGATTWYDYARTVIALARAAGWQVKVEQDRIVPVHTNAYPLPARRPQNSRLNCGKFGTAFDLVLPPWSDGVRRVVAELTAN
jgi:dTDP-4-dehydrorhamnose reductase